MVLCYKITHKYKELLPFLLYLMIASIYYENVGLPVKLNTEIGKYPPWVVWIYNITLSEARGNIV